jgi:chromosome segregation ATPase
MLDEDKIKKDLEKMREAYEKAQKSLEAVKARQRVIAESISKYKAKNKNLNKPQWEV